MNSRLLVKRLFTVFLYLAAPFAALAQTKSISGKVTSAKDGSPIAGASVLATGGSGKAGTQTGTDGTYKITVPSGTTTLVITSIGFDKQEVSIAGKTTIDIVLKVAVSDQLNEIVVLSYASPRPKDVTGAVTSLKAKDFNQGLILAPDQLLQNKVAGLEVTNTSGQPGAAPTIQIRGTSSIRANNNPLYVVDGVALDGNTARPTLGGPFGSTPASNPLLYIDPNSIAQIDVLKDASSAAIYGARGANGVIIITTKKGAAGPMKVEVGINNAVNAGYMKRFAVLDASQFRTAMKKYGVDKKYDLGGNVDALKEISQNAFSQNYSVAMSGGNGVGKFRASFLASSTKGFLKKSALDKYLATFGGSYKFLDNKLSIDFGVIAGNYGEQLTSVSNTAGSEGNIISSALQWNPTYALRAANGTYNDLQNGAGNPLAFNDAYNDKSNVTSILANFTVGYKLTKNLEYKFLYGVNYGTGKRNLNLDGWISGVAAVSSIGAGYIASAELFSQTFTHTLNYSASISKGLTLQALAGYEYFKTDYSGASQSAFGFKTNLDFATRIPILYTSIFQNAKTQNPYFPFVNPTGEIQSYFGRATFTYLDKYSITGTLRRDGSSKFGSNNKYGNFPSVGVKWDITNESFMKKSKVISDLALRASYGVTGNQEFPAGSSQEQFSFTSFNKAPQVVNGNPSLKWETTKSFNVGLNFALLKGKFYGTFDYYNKKTTDILFQTNAIQPAPASISFVNLKDAQLINSGFELALGATIIDKKDFGWESNFNIAYNKNKVQNFIDPNTGINLIVRTAEVSGQGVSGTLAQVIANGQPVNVYYLKSFQGYNADSSQKISDPGTETFAGDPNPHFIYGFSNTLRYKKFSLGINFGGGLGFLIYNNTATSVTNIAGIKNGRNIDLAAYNSQEGTKSSAAASTRFLEKGDYLKCRNVTLRYTVGNAGKYVKNLTLFVSGTNLFVITGFTGFDPEVNIDKSSNSYPSRSIEYIPYPTARTISFGLNFSL